MRRLTNRPVLLNYCIQALFLDCDLRITAELWSLILTLKFIMHTVGPDTVDALRKHFHVHGVGLTVKEGTK